MPESVSYLWKEKWDIYTEPIQKGGSTEDSQTKPVVHKFMIILRKQNYSLTETG